MSIYARAATAVLASKRAFELPSSVTKWTSSDWVDG
jgi:hypothetical protein